MTGDDQESYDLIDDETIDAILDGRPVDADFDHLANFVDDAAALSDRPPPQPSPTLAALIAQGRPAHGRPARSSAHSEVRSGRRRRASAAAGVAGLGVMAKL